MMGCPPSPTAVAGGGGGAAMIVGAAGDGGPQTEIRIFAIFFILIKFAIMGWIRTDFALLNTLANCDFYRFFEILIFS